MAQVENPWDALAEHFSPDDAGKITVDNADTILLAQPVIVDALNQTNSEPYAISPLDFGCGTGQFADKLQRIGYNVMGLDSSRGMIDRAEAQYPDIPFEFGTAQSLFPDMTFDSVTSIMTFQFIRNIEETIDALAQRIDSGGTLLLAVHNQAFVRDWAREGKRHVNYDSTEKPTQGTLQFGQGTELVEVPIFIRTADQYTEMAQRVGMSLIVEDYPEFTTDFLERYPIDGPTEHPEYMILGYQKD